MAIQSVNRVNSTFDKYDVLDTSLIPSKLFTRNFGEDQDYVEAHLYTKDGRLLSSNYNVKDFKLPSPINSESTLVNSLIFDPANYITNLGYNVGDFKLEYRVFRKKLFTLSQPTFFISEISKDRIEVRIMSNVVSNATLEENTLNFLYEFQTSQYYKDFLLNFSKNKIVNAVNIALDKSTSPYSIVIKLYKPLPAEFNLKSPLWVVEELADPIVFEVVIVPDPVRESVQMLGPVNFDVDVESHKSVSSTYQSLDSIYSTNDTNAYQNVLNRLSNNSININVDYSNYSDFIHFSSAQQRLTNFLHKLELIEAYQSDINTLKVVPNYSGSLSVSSSIYSVQSNLNDLVIGMDKYETYLYSATASTAWPKISGSILYPTTSSTALSWFGNSDQASPYYGGQSSIAYLFDLENQNNLTYLVPEYLAMDEQNSDYLLFINMLAQQFDDVWVYIKSMNDLHKAENAITEGISKDMVFSALRSLGVKVYNNNTNENIFDYLIGSTSGSYTVTGVTPPTSGEDRSKELFKRIYHNLPYLLKSKGTTKGLKSLITTFGIPDTILDVTEYGGSDKFGNTLEYSYDRFNYAFNLTGSSYFSAYWVPLQQNIVKYGVDTLLPDSLEFRFRPDLHNIKPQVTLLQKYNVQESPMSITMAYTSSNGVPSANINFILSTVSSSVTLPIYSSDSDGSAHWWNVLLRRNTKYYTPISSSLQTYDMIVQNSISGRIGQVASASFSTTSSIVNAAWDFLGTLSLGSPAISSSIYPTGSAFYGQLQELRFWSEPLQTSAFNSHTLSSVSIEGNYLTSSYSDLAARFPLGNNLDLTASYSTHPDSKTMYSVFLNYGFYVGPKNFLPLNEISYNSSPNSGYYSPVTDKVRIVSNVIEGNILSPFLRLEENPLYRTVDTHFTDVSFSPQNLIDKDIIAEYGSKLNLDDYIGDPATQYEKTYNSISLLKQNYYRKFIKSLSYKDFIKLIDQFDNSLFKMLEEYKPARTNLSTGVTIKSPLLERNRITRFKPVLENYSTKSFTITGSGIVIDTPYSNKASGSEFFKGELSGSSILLDDHFEQNNNNPYAIYKEDLNKNLFEHSYFNVLYGNIVSQRPSSKFKKIDKHNPKLLSVAELQDDYYTYRRHINPRYEGCKSFSRFYNDYSLGDGSYGKNAAIDRKSFKIGYVNEASVNNLNFIDKTTFNLKYLIDASASVLELSKQNNNIFEVQNLFKSGENIVISLSDPLNPSNQAVLGGTKKIYEGGYSYSPILYREINEPLVFNYLQPTSTTTSRLGFKAVSTNLIRWVKSDPGRYTFAVGDTGDNIVQFYLNGTRQAIGTKLSETDSGNASTWPYNNEIPFSFSGLVTYQNGGTSNFTSQADSKQWYALDWFLPSSTSTSAGGYVTTDFLNSVLTIDNSVRKFTVFTAPRQSTYNVNVNIPIKINSTNPRVGYSSLKLVGVIEKFVNGSWVYVTNTTMNVVSTTPARSDMYLGTNSDQGFILYDIKNGADFGGELFVNCVINNYQISLNQGEQVRLRMYFLELNDVFYRSENFVFKLDAGTAYQGYLEIYDAVASATTTIVSTTVGTTPQIFTLDTSNHDTLIFSDSASILYNNSIFNPTGSSISDKYSPVVNEFFFETGDLVRFNSYYTSNADLYKIIGITYPVILHSGSVNSVVTPLKVKIDQQINPVLINSATKFAFIRRREDETSVAVDFKKPEGIVSSAVLVPNNLDKLIKSDIANILQKAITVLV